MGDRPERGANMCFSAEADFVSGAVIGAIGVATLTQVDKPRQIPLAALPLAFALHQFTEGFVWRELDAGATHATGPAVYAYLVFAWILIPVLVPLAIMALEPPGRTRRRIGVFVGIGTVAAAYLSASLLAGDVWAHPAGHTVLYGGVGRYADAATALYIVATCGAPLLSSHRLVRGFAVANVVAVGVIATVQARGLTSIWCSWAATVSILIFFQLVAWRNADRDELAREGEQSDQVTAASM